MAGVSSVLEPASLAGCRSSPQQRLLQISSRARGMLTIPDHLVRNLRSFHEGVSHYVFRRTKDARGAYMPPQIDEVSQGPIISNDKATGLFSPIGQPRLLGGYAHLDMFSGRRGMA